MLKLTTRILFVISLYCNDVAGQKNIDIQRQIDSIDLVVKIKCDSSGPSKSIKRKHFRHDKKALSALNTFYNQDLQLPEISYLLRKGRLFKGWDWDDSTVMGALTLYQTGLKSEGVLHPAISIALLDGIVVAKRIAFESKIWTDCLNPYEPWAHVLYVPYIKKLTDRIDFPIHFNPYWDIIADTTLFSKLVSLNPYYTSLLTGDSAHFFNELTWHSITIYNGRKNNPLDHFVKTGQWETIEKLLFSPNHIVAIYAFEALRTKPGLKPEITQQLEKVFNSPIKIKWMSSDVGHSGKTYKELMGSFWNLN